MASLSPTKTQFYSANGAGRDSYIYGTNGGFCPMKEPCKIEELGKWKFMTIDSLRQGNHPIRPHKNSQKPVIEKSACWKLSEQTVFLLKEKIWQFCVRDSNLRDFDRKCPGGLKSESKWATDLTTSLRPWPVGQKTFCVQFVKRSSRCENNFWPFFK